MTPRSNLRNSFAQLMLWFAILGLSSALEHPIDAQNTPLFQADKAAAHIYVKQVSVPALYGLTRDEASTRLSTIGLQPSFEGDTNGTVARQLPEVGATVPQGSSVLLVLIASKTPSDAKKSPKQSQEVSVPPLGGLTREEASMRLSAIGLQPSFEGDANGTVARQSPEVGATVPQGSSVLLVLIATVPPPQETVLVPDVTKRSRDEASAILSKSGLTIGKIEGPQTGIVARQFPPVRTVVPLNSAVTLQMVTPDIPPPPPRPTPPPPGLATRIEQWIAANPTTSLIALALLCAVAVAGVKVLKPGPLVCTLYTAHAKTVLRGSFFHHPDVTQRIDLVHRSFASYQSAEGIRTYSTGRGSR